MQPFAGVVVDGIKPIDNRSWPTDYRGPIAIHASSKFFPGMVDELQRYGVAVASPERKNWPTMAILGTVEIADCVFFNSRHDEPAIIDAAKAAGILSPRSKKVDIDKILPWAHGRYCWIFRNPIKFREPIPALGKLNLWYLSSEQQAAVAQAIAAASALED